MARLLNLGRDGFLGFLFNVIFRDAYHDFEKSNTTHFTNINGGGNGSNKSFDNAYFTGGSKDSIQFSETVIKTLAALIKKCPVKEEEEGKADDDDVVEVEDPECGAIDRVELLKAYNDIIIDLKSNGVLSYFELDFLDGNNADIVRESPFFKWYYDNYGRDEMNKERHEKNIDILNNMIENPGTQKTSENLVKVSKMLKRNLTEADLPDLVEHHISELTKLTDYLENIPLPPHPIYESSGGLLINLYILDQKKEVNKLTYDEFIMLILLNKQLDTNKSKIIEYFKNKDIALSDIIQI